MTNRDRVILTVNAGSSSLRLAAFVATGAALSPLASGHFPGVRNGLVEILRRFLGDHGIREVTAVAHRVVHGGARLRPSGWIRVMKGAISKNASYFNSHRMMRRYATEAYIR